ncbi:OmpA family protein [Stutzerimonas azotifigens]|uniref:OmpA family protein n=1 Tax=Stutzerimonas azotifigens TaxID=291995 RepID=A0ABR5YYR3_9GAMM|nr:OmpA family protein [Stutzerimonas azotifigens]MBA1273098.1 OmpA family protein [Stutzerimonas azotifigens]
MRVLLYSLVLLMFALGGCASKSYVVLLESPDGSTGAIVVSDSMGTTRVERKQQAVTLGGLWRGQFSVPQTRLDRDFSAALAAQPALPETFLIYFQTGGASLTPASEAEIPRVLDTIRTRGPSAVSVTGHTDTVSGARWNEQLGLIRAQAIADLLKARGLQVIELKVQSHGERNLLVKTPDDTPEPRNRRVEIIVR